MKFKSLKYFFKKLKYLLGFQIKTQNVNLTEVPKKGTVKETVQSVEKTPSKKIDPIYKLNEEQRKIKDIVIERNIQSLVHFTRLENLESILKHGLVPVSVINRMGYKAVCTDYDRLDNEEDAVSISISFPNYKYFYSLRQNRYPDKSWVVIELKPDILWEKDCVFCKTNAANTNIRNTFIYDRKGATILRELFAENGFKVNRKILNIPDYYTTDPQAEVLVFGTIPPKYIKAVYYNDNKLTKYMQKIKYEKIFLDDSYFKQRKDYSYWGYQGGYYGY